MFGLTSINNTYSQGINSLSFGTDSTLEVVSWNIEWFPKNGNNTADSVSKIIKALDADIIGVQEIDDTTLFKQVIDGIPGYKLHIEKGGFRGLAYVYNTSTVFAKSFYKIFDNGNFGSAFPRIPVVMEFLYKGKEYVVINNHYKCCGDGTLDIGNSNDEETRRLQANTLLKQYIDSNFINSKVFVIGDLNDILTDSYQNNVFRMFYEDNKNFKFADEEIARGPIADWSYPSWPSHLDHILITNELFDAFSHPSSICKTIRVDDFLPGGFGTYDFYVSDHRPVGLKLMIENNTTGTADIDQNVIKIYPNPSVGNFQISGLNKNYKTQIKIIDFAGRVINSETFEAMDIVNLSLNGSSGIYFLIIETNSELIVKKVFKY